VPTIVAARAVLWFADVTLNVTLGSRQEKLLISHRAAAGRGVAVDVDSWYAA
jgi:hypothetical protein